MKKILSIFSLLVCVFLTSSAYSQPYYQPYPQSCVGCCGEQYAKPCRHGHFYVGGFGGANWLNADSGHYHGENLKFNTGYTGALSLGYKMNNLRFEGEVAYRHNN